MKSYSLKDKKKIAEVLQLMISNQIEIKVRINGKNTAFSSKVIKQSFNADAQNDALSSTNTAELIIEKLTPQKGNNLIQSAKQVLVECLIEDRSLRFETTYLGISSIHPYFGIIIGFPEAIKFLEKRKERRIVAEVPDFLYVEFMAGEKGGNVKKFSLKVVNCSDHGFGLLVRENDFDLVNILRPGYLIRKIRFYAEWAYIDVEATVSHLTQIRTGKHKGRYILGVKSSEIIESCKPPD